MEELRTRVLRCKKDLGISFRGICESCSIPQDSFDMFARGRRELPEDYVYVLNKYLRNFGY